MVRGTTGAERLSVQQVHRHLAKHSDDHDRTNETLGGTDLQGETRTAPALSAVLPDCRTAQVWNYRCVPEDRQTS